MTDDNHDDEPKSKSQIKREMHALQDLGKRLTQLSAQQFAKVPLEPTLASAILEYNRLKSNSAKRRQMQYIGKLMRDIDVAAIEQAIALYDASTAIHARHFHQLEKWRERLLDEPTALTEFLNQYPHADPQQLRQLIRNTQKDISHDKNLGHSRKLFRYLREIAGQDE